MVFHLPIQLTATEERLPSSAIHSRRGGDDDLPANHGHGEDGDPDSVVVLDDDPRAAATMILSATGSGKAPKAVDCSAFAGKIAVKPVGCGRQDENDSHAAMWDH